MNGTVQKMYRTTKPALVALFYLIRFNPFHLIKFDKRFTDLNPSAPITYAIPCRPQGSGTAAQVI